MKDILLYLWQLPQNLLGLILCLIYPDKFPTALKDVKVHVNQSFPSGISLGNYIIVKYVRPNTISHEYGHHLQSLKWGWLYLIVIGLPSLTGNIIDRLFHKKWDWLKREQWYYNQPWEKSADKLGGVKRF